MAAWALGGIIANQADASEFGCKSQICPACLAAAIPICSRDDTSARDGRPNGFAPLDCVRLLFLLLVVIRVGLNHRVGVESIILSSSVAFVKIFHLRSFVRIGTMQCDTETCSPRSPCNLVARVKHKLFRQR